MENGSLQQYLKIIWHEQLLPEMHRLFSLLFQVVSGLQYLHHKGIIHGDLMPSNVLIDENENALLADFGLSHLLEHETSFFKSLGPGAIRWADPKIISFNPANSDEEVSKPSKKSDIYSFGCIMMQVLSGQTPYFDINEHSVPVAKFQGTPPRRPPAITDEDHWCYIERCLSLCVDTRPLVDEVLEYIEAERDKQLTSAGCSCQ
jgi:serine/threonine protein kinase